MAENYIPDTNTWRGCPAFFFEADSSRRFSVSWTVVEEALTISNEGIRRSTVEKILKYAGSWLKSESELVSDVIKVARKYSICPAPPFQSSERVVEYRETARVAIQPAHGAYLEQARANRKSGQKEGQKSHRALFDEVLHRSNRTGETVTSDPIEMTLKCFNPKSEWYGVPLKAMLHGFRCEASEGRAKKIIKDLDRFPGLKFFYTHIMYGCFRAMCSGDDKQTIGKSLYPDAKIMLAAGPRRQVITSDKELHATQDLFFGKTKLCVRPEEIGGL